MKIFILGCQRSGTNLLRLILNSHPEICCYDEQIGYKILSGEKSPSHQKKYEGFTVPIWTELFFEYDSISSLCTPEDKILFLFRNPKSVISSMKQMSTFVKNEIKNKRFLWSNDPNRSFKDYLICLERYNLDKILNNVDDEIIRNYLEDCLSKLEETMLACAYYNYKTDTYNKIKRENVFPLCYEHLILNSLQRTNDICKFLGIEWSEEMLKHHEKEHSGVKDNLTIGGTNAKRAIDHCSLKLWEKNLLPSEIKLIEELSAGIYEKLLADDKITPY